MGKVVHKIEFLGSNSLCGMSDSEKYFLGSLNVLKITCKRCLKKLKEKGRK